MREIKLSICNEMFEGWNIEDVFRYASEIGYDGVEIAPFTLAESVADITKSERDRIKSAAENSGIEVVGLHWLLVSPKGLYINHPEKTIRDRTLDYMIKLIEFCSDIGGKVMIVGSPKQRSVLQGYTYRDAWDLTVEFFKGCLDVAAERDVIICIEPLDPAQTNFINTAEEGLKLVKDLNHPNFRLMIDVRSSIHGEDIPVSDLIRKYSDHISHVHANDGNGRGPGFGDTDFGPISQALMDVNYRGYVSVEVFDFSPDPETIAKESYNYLKRFFK